MRNEHSDNAPGQDKGITIIVNGRQREVTGHTLSYRDIVQLAYPGEGFTEEIVYTVSYANPHGRDGTLVDGQDLNGIKEGMVFNVIKTNRS